MFRLIKSMLWLVALILFVWIGTSVKLGKHTLFVHIARIWRAEETQDLVKGAKEKAAPTVKKVKEHVSTSEAATAP